MRYLHPVTVNEHFVASGTYRHYVDEAPTGLEEYWSIHAMPDGAWMLRADVDGRGTNGPSLLIEAWRSPETRLIERFDISAFAAGNAPIRHVRATYSIFDDYVEIGRTLDGAPRHYEELAVPPGTLAPPPASLFRGAALAGRETGEHALFTVNPHFQDATAFAGLLLREQIDPGANESVTVGRRTYTARAYSVQAVDSGASIRCWLDDHHIMVRQVHDGGHVLLHDYAYAAPGSAESSP